MRRVFPFLLSLLLSIAGPAFAASQINSLPPITPFPLTDPGCQGPSSVENLWIANGSGSGADMKISPTQLGYIFQGSVAPLCPFRYQLWWNTGITPSQLQIYDGAQWLVAGALDFTNHIWSLPNPVISGTVTGTYTLGGTVTITSPTINTPVLSGTVTGTYTLAGTVSITSPTISNPTITGTVTGTNIFPLSSLAQIGAFTVLGNATNATANVTAAYGVSGTGTTLASTFSTFTAGDILVAADIKGTVQSSATLGSTIYYRFLNAGATSSLQILNNSSNNNTGAQLSLNTGTTNNVGQLTLLDAAAAANRKLSLVIGNATGGGITIDASGGGVASPLALIGGSNADGITLSGTSEVLYSFSNPGSSIAFRALNSNTSSSTSAALTAQTGTAGATATLSMTDGGTPTARVVSGNGATGGLTLQTGAGPISLQPLSATTPQVLVSDTNAGATTQMLIQNGSDVLNTVASLQVQTLASDRWINMSAQDLATPQAFISTGAGLQAGLQITTSHGPVYILPSTGVIGSIPHFAVQFNANATVGEAQFNNPSTAAGTVSAILIGTGASQSYLYEAVSVNGAFSLLQTGAGLTGGITIDSHLGGAGSALQLTSGGDIFFNPPTSGHLNVTNTGSFVAATNCGSLSSSTGCLAIKDYNANTVYLPVYGTL